MTLDYSVCGRQINKRERQSLSVKDGEVPSFRHSVSYSSNIMGFNTMCSLKIVESKYTDIKFSKLINNVEMFCHEPSLGTG